MEKGNRTNQRTPSQRKPSPQGVDRSHAFEAVIIKLKKWKWTKSSCKTRGARSLHISHPHSRIPSLPFTSLLPLPSQKKRTSQIRENSIWEVVEILPNGNTSFMRNARSTPSQPRQQGSSIPKIFQRAGGLYSSRRGERPNYEL